jgi:hypothetical protein
MHSPPSAAVDDRPTLGRRSPRAWRLAWRALREVAWIRVALWRWPYARVRAGLAVRAARRATRAPATDPRADPDTLAWAVRAAARRVPSASCLTQALALQTLLGEVGIGADLRIGVARDPDGAFRAHAWLEHDGRVVIGHLPDLERYAVLPAGAPPLPGL